jgi:hypothetical protein
VRGDVWQEKMNWKKTILRIVLGLIGIGVLAFIGLMIFIWLMFPRETHSLRKYPHLRAQWNQELVGHFPDPIPESASLTKFSHFPGFLQGGAHIQLRLALPSEQIQELYERFLQKRTKSFLGGNTNRHMNEKDGMPTTFFKTGDKDQSSFPKDFEIMIFDPVLPESERPEGHYWNHGKSHGVAISTNRNEIVYWAESW